MMKHETQTDSVQIYNVVVGIVEQHGVANEDVKNLLDLLRANGFAEEVEAAIWEVENKLFNCVEY